MRRLLALPAPIVLAGAHDGLTARLVHEAGFDGVWASGFENGTLVEVDARTVRVIRRIEIGGAPTGLLRAAGSIWVGLGRGATSVLRVDLLNWFLSRGALKYLKVSRS